VLANASNSAEYLSSQLNADIDSGFFKTVDQLREHIDEEYVRKGLGIVDASEDELQLIIERPRAAVYYFANMISQRAQVGWSTHGHSAVDVNIYGTSGSDPLRGNNENTDVGKFLREYLDVDVDKITEELISGSKVYNIASDTASGWTGRIPTDQDILSVSRHYEELYSEAP
jgi:alkaline phosphatase